MNLVIPLLMWLLLFASVTVAFCVLLLEFVLRDSTEYDLEFIWDHRFTREDLHLDPEEG